MLASSSPPYFSASILRNDQLAVHLKDAKAALSRRPACPPPTMWVARVEQAAGLLPPGWLCGPCIRRCADRPARDVCAPGLSSLRPESRVCGHAFGVPVGGLMPGAHVALAAEPNAAVNVVARNALAAPDAQLAARTLVTALALCFVACAAPATVGLAARGGHQPLSTGLYTTLQPAVGTPLGHSRRYALISFHYFRRSIATVERREASVPRHGTQGASQAPGVPRHVHAPRVPRKHPHVSRRSAHPSIRVSEAKLQTPGVKNAPRELAGLFDIVRWITKASESAACPGCDAARASASSASLIRDRQELGPRSRVCSAPLRAALRPGHARAAKNRSLWRLVQFSSVL